MYRLFIKRAFDLVFAFLLILPSIPVVIIIAVISAIIHLSFKVFFVQTRIGHENKKFKIIKLRTMSNKKDTKGALLPDKERVTPFGLFLRRTSLDELPQLINVILGDMSLVGPRPFTPEDCKLYCSPAQMSARHSIRPGLTGLAQVYGRNSINFDKRIRYDLFYVNHVSFALDMKIVFRTANVILE